MADSGFARAHMLQMALSTGCAFSANAISVGLMGEQNLQPVPHDEGIALSVGNSNCSSKNLQRSALVGIVSNRSFTLSRIERFPALR